MIGLKYKNKNHDYSESYNGIIKIWMEIDKI